MAEDSAAEIAAEAAADNAAPDTSLRCEGLVTTWHGTWGFIACSDGRRAYVHNASCGGSPLVPGQSVTAEIVPDPKNPGKWQAQDVERQAAFDASGSMIGVVSEWWSTYGFIQFSDGHRAYCHNSSCSTPLREGELVVGTLVDDPKNLGKFTAIDVKKAQSFPAADDSGKLTGVVVSWTGRYGFIDFTDGRRAYCHSSACGGGQLYAGQEVKGLLVEDARNPGKWQAQEVECTGSAANDGALRGQVVQWTGTWGFILFSDGRRAHVHTTGTGGVFLQEGDAVLGLVVEDSMNAGKWQAVQVERVHPDFAWGQAGRFGHIRAGRIEGIVTEWNEKGYGFMKCSDGRRAFVHNSSCPDGASLEPGQVVTATVLEDQRNPGKWQAWEVKSPMAVKSPVARERPPAPQPARMPQPWRQLKSVRRCGSVVEWNQRGFGFVIFEDGTRAYLHSSECGGEHLTPTELVSADLVPDPRTPGKWQAINVVRGAVDLLGPTGGCPLPGGCPLLGGFPPPGGMGMTGFGPPGPRTPLGHPLGHHPGAVGSGRGRRQQGMLADWSSRGIDFMQC